MNAVEEIVKVRRNASVSGSNCVNKRNKNKIEGKMTNYDTESSQEAVPACSSAKSDFSIEHILTKAGEKNLVAAKPAWLACTRYRPPNIPRRKDSQVFGKRARRSNCHARIPFTAQQSLSLEESFARSKYLSPAQLTTLANELHIREQRIKIWFQNRRARERRESGLGQGHLSEGPLHEKREPTKNNYEYYELRY